jgi:hypothetical protein
MKKINIINIVVSIICLSLYMFFMIRDGNRYLNSYGFNILFIGALISVVLLLLSLFKYLRNGLWMDIIYMFYLLLIIVGDFLSRYVWNNKYIYGIFINYPSRLKYILIVLLVVNIVFFIISLKEEV